MSDDYMSAKEEREAQYARVAVLLAIVGGSCFGSCATHAGYENGCETRCAPYQVKETSAATGCVCAGGTP